MITITNRIGQSAALICKPWWTSHAYQCDGKVCVARVDGKSLTQRYKDRVEGESRGYMSGTEAEGFTGDFLTYMIDLTQEQIDEIKNNPEYNNLPEPHFCESIDKPRPKTNTVTKVSTPAEQQAVYAQLQNEGCEYAADIDNTPYQKGDQYAE